MKLKHILLGALAAASFNTMQGATVLLLDDVLTGATPSGSAPWATITITDVAPGEVKLRIDANLQDTTEFFDKLGLVYGDGALPLDVDNIGIKDLAGATWDSIQISPTNSTNLGAGSGAGFVIDFVNSNSNGGANRFNDNDFFEVTLYDTNGVATWDADTLFTDSVAHINGVGGANSAWVTNNVPEPSTALFGLLGLLPFMRRRR